MFKSTRKAFLLLVIFSLLLNSVSAYAATNTKSEPNDPVVVINGMLESIENQNPQDYIKHFTKENRIEMEAYLLDNSGTPFFREKSASLIKVKELPQEIAKTAASLTESELESGTRAYYAEINFKVDKQDKWLYNGANHRLIVMTIEDNNWKIARISVPSIKYLNETGQSFKSKEEEAALKIEDALQKKGIVIDLEGNIIENLASAEEDLAREKGKEKGDITQYQVSASSNPTYVAGTTSEYTRPSYIKVYFLNSTNKNYWGKSTASVPFYDYCIDVLPNEWYASWYTTAPAAVKAGALAAKMYGWYHVYHPKWNYSPYYADVKDGDTDQVYVVNSRHTNTTKAINDVGGIGLDRPSGSSYILFETQYIDGSYAAGGQNGGKMWQNGTKYWADQGDGYTFMCHYYYDYSTNTGGQLAHFFYY